MKNKFTLNIDLRQLPGGDIAIKGLDSLNQGELGEEALLLLIASPKLTELGFIINSVITDKSFEHCLYEIISRKPDCDHHSYYNSLIRKITSLARAIEQVLYT